MLTKGKYISEPISSDLFSTAKTNVIFKLLSKSLSKGLNLDAISFPYFE